MAQQFAESISEARARYALLLSASVTPHDMTASVSEAPQDTYDPKPSPGLPQVVSSTAVNDSQHSQKLQHRAFESVFKRFASTKDPLSELTSALADMIHQTAIKDKALMTPDLVGLLLRELAVVFCRLRGEEMVLLARTWLRLLDLVPILHLRPHESSAKLMDQPTIADTSLILVAAESLLKMIEHVRGLPPTARHDNRILHRVELLLLERVDKVARIVSQWPLIDVDGKEIGMDKGSRRFKVLIRHKLLHCDSMKSSVPVDWYQMMRLFEAARCAKGHPDAPMVMGRCRSMYMRMIQHAFLHCGEAQGEHVVGTSVLPQELLVYSRILPYFPDEKAPIGERMSQTQRFGRLWRRVFIRMIERGAEWDGPGGFSSVLETYIDVLKRTKVISSCRHPSTSIRGKAMLRDLTEKIFLPYVARGIHESCVLYAKRVHGSRRRKALERVKMIFEMLGVQHVDIGD
ncbi:hypothetical protein FRB97_005732 [Tulasnella sp. 331]|nr:hypothetical protein FRB97_005732 [Tulasnella sp. 331]KAG8879573.1 hypothetical protein FRB98_005653 [Tulasnella sp. 332]